MPFHIPFNQRASATAQVLEPVYIGFERPLPPRQKFNWWGFNGMWMSLVGLLSAGFLSPVPLLISVIELRRPGRKMALTGTIVSLVGIGLATSLVLGGIANARHHQHARQAAKQQAKIRHQVNQTHGLLSLATEELVEYRDQNQGDLPNDIDANMLVLKHVDPWGEVLRYDAEIGHGVIRSAGPDRKFDSKDDVVSKVKGTTHRDTLLNLAD